MHKLVLGCAAALVMTTSTAAQNPLRHFTESVDARFSRAQPVIHYTLTIADGDTTGFDVRIDIRNARDTFRVAMAKHPEYDDRFFRFVERVRVLQPNASIVRRDSVLWRVVAPGGVASIEYRIALPQPAPAQRGAWRPFLTSRGTLTGGPHAFMYVVGAELAPAHVSLRLPANWVVATGLTPTSEPRTFYAASAYVLVESPILAGDVSTWQYAIDGVPHTIAYWRAPTGTPFDTTTFRRNVELMTREAVALFGRPPYREFVFQFQDLAFGGLEHPNSVSLGAPSADLARNPNAVLQETAHEFFHTWNLMRIRPAEYTDVDYRQIKPVPTLWFSEGLTIFYADLLLRRAKLPTSDSTRTTHLEGIITRYLASPALTRFSAEQVARVAYNAPPDALGDYGASTHLQGEVIGAMLDLIIRDATNGRRSMDDVMRLMLERFSGERGFVTADVERAVQDVCGCSVKAFFDAHVRGAGAIPFDRYLAMIGMRANVAWQPALQDGRPIADRRLAAWNPPDSSLSLLVGNPTTVWGRAGLHSGDRVVTVNEVATRTWPEFRQIIGRANIGDTVRFVVRSPHATTTRVVNVVVSGYERPFVKIEQLPGVTEKQRRLREAWLAGAP